MMSSQRVVSLLLLIIVVHFTFFIVWQPLVDEVKKRLPQMAEHLAKVKDSVNLGVKSDGKQTTLAFSD